MFNLSARASPAFAATLLVTAPATLSPPAPTVMDRAGERLVGSRYHRPLANYQDFLPDQRPRNRFSRAFKDAGEGRAGNAHPLGSGFLVETFEIGQPQSLEFVQS